MDIISFLKIMDYNQIDNSNNNLLKNIINNNDLSRLIILLTAEDILFIDSYLENKDILYLRLLLKYILKKENLNLSIDNITYNLVKIYDSCDDNNCSFINILNLSKKLVYKKGGKYNNSTNSNNSKKTNNTTKITMKGITLTLRSIIDRKVDKQKIDNNLIEGAIERRKISNEKLRKKGKNIKSEQDTLNTLSEPIKIEKINKKEDDKAVEDYKKAVDVLKNSNINNPLDIPLSQPLDEPPVGNSGATIIQVNK